jgi:A/G-specific adenine glycosylase
MYYLIVKYKNKFYIRKREEKDIWQNLYEFILLEMPKPVTLKNLHSIEKFKLIFALNEFKIESISQVYQQHLTHQTINGQFICITVRSPLGLVDYKLITPTEIKQLPFPKFITTYLKD